MPFRYDPPYIVNEPPYHPPEASTFTWTSPAGRVTNLADFDDQEGGVLVLPGSIGLGMPKTTYFETNSPTFDGSTVHGSRVEAREISLPIVIYGKDRANLLTRWRRLVDDFRPNRSLGPGTLTLTQYNGESRSIQAWYTGGFDGNDDDQAWANDFISAVVSLRCPLPYWIGETVTQTFGTTGNGQNDPTPDTPSDPGDTTSPTARQAFFPLLPLVLAGGLPVTSTPDPEPDDPDVPEQILTAVGTLDISYTGNAVCYPVWTFTGPCDSIRLTNTVTGQYFEVANGVAAGRELVVDAREQFRTVVEHVPGTPGINGVGSTDPTTLNRYGDITGVLWPLSEGTNTVAISAPGIAADSNLKVTWQQRFQTGY